MIETPPNRPTRLTIPLVAGLVLVVAFFLPWFRVGPWLGASGAGIVGATFAALTRFVAEHRATALMLPLLCVLLPAGGIAVVWTELLGRSTRNLQLTVACVAPALVVLLCTATRDVHVLTRLDVGSSLTIAASLTLAATGAGLLEAPLWRGALWWRALNTAVAVVLVLCVAGAGVTAFEHDYGSRKVLLVLGDVGKRLDAGDPGPSTPTFAAGELDVESATTDTTEPTVGVPVDGDVTDTPVNASGGASPVLVGRGTLTPRNGTSGTGSASGSGGTSGTGGTGGTGGGSGSSGTTATTRAGSTGTTTPGTPPTTTHPTTTHATTTTVPCPVGKPTSKVSDSEVTYHDPGDDYYEADVTVTVSNKASRSIDVFYAEILVNGEPNEDGNPRVGMSGSLAPGTSKSFTGKVYVRTPNGEAPSFTVIGLSYRWSDASYRGRCDT